MKRSRLHRLLDLVSRSVGLISAVIGGTSIAVMVSLITVDVVGRYFGRPTLIASEISGYLLVALTFFGLTWTQKKGKHIRISVLTQRLSPKKRRYLSVAIFIVSIIFLTWLVWLTAVPAIRCYTMGIISLTPLGTPMWIPYMFVPVGLAIFVIQLLSQLIRQEALEGGL